MKHLRCVLIKKFLKMIDNIQKSDTMLFFLRLVKSDGETVTGRTSRYIWLLTGRESAPITMADSSIYIG